ncbi:protein diaphanous homolog 3-like [Acanthaster planci]|uniref:Protein diaphanous homolog 3-like n=1 Tax=Acanthaster planci TaxID=133434 RepID=A0A8B7ZN42_ACAPL|nr:protein diaphanous homolog 3-like [Acanthaster planci]
MCRLLCLIVENNKSSAKGRVLTQADLRGTLRRCQQVIKEGFLEKKNHNLYTTYTRRWIRIREGELSYYKPDDDNQQALNILQLSDDVTIVKKLNFNGFSIATRKKVYFFRIIPSANVSAADIEKERDEWFKAIRFACGDRRDSVAIFVTDETLHKNSLAASAESKPTSESFYQAMRHFQEELERLSLVINSLDERGDATKALLQLQQKAKVIETMFSQIRPSSDTSCSGISTSVDTETSSHLDQASTVTLETGEQSYDEPLPLLIKSDRHSLIISNNWVLHNGCSAGLMNGNSVIVDPSEPNSENHSGNDTHSTDSLEQRTDMIVNGITSCSSSSLSAVFESFIPPPPAPPPPPEMVAPITRKFEVTSKVKMRPFHWNKVSALMIKKSIWQNARDLTGKVDTEFLQQMYSQKSEHNIPEAVEKVETSKRKLKTFLDPKVAQNLGIFLAGFKMDAEELKFRLAILSEKDGGLSAEQINMLRRYYPTAEDMETYKKFKERQAELENADQFMLQLCEIPHLKTKLDVLMVVNELPVQYEDLAPTIDKVHDASKLLCTSEKFVSILEHVLAVGNFINSGSAQGVSMGFRLTSLPKLADCRGRDKTCTLLKYVVQQIYKESPELLTFVDEFTPMTQLFDVSVKALEAEVEVMKRDLNNIKKNMTILAKVENPSERDVSFFDDVAAFVEQYELKVTSLQKKSEAMKFLYEQMLERFAEPRGIDSSDIFTAIGNFVKSFKREMDLILAASGLGRRMSKMKVNQSYLKKDDKAHIERGAQFSSCNGDTEKKINGEPIDDSPSNHVAALRKAFSSGDNKPYSKQGRELLKAFQNKKQERRHIWNPTKEGYLEKLSNTKSPLTSSWNRRFFELTAKGHLYYSKRKNEKNVESIYLRGVPVALEDDKTLILQTEERCYKLRANSHKEAQEWLECILFYTHKPASFPKRSLTPKSFEVQ